MSLSDKYAQMRDNGATAEQVYLTAKQDRLSAIDQLKVLRLVFNLSSVEAKEIAVKAEGLGETLDEYQEQFKTIVEDLLTEESQKE